MDQIEKLKKLKAKMGLTNGQLAKLLLSTERALYYWLSGERKMNPWSEWHLDCLLQAFSPETLPPKNLSEIS